jgi:tRNA threonylcarbamoyladenosine biosynthesis protein TsaE
MATCISHSPAETQALGEVWGREAASGLVIGLTGDLGAGKTQLAKGVARGLGITALVHSPTFALINEYTGGRLTLFHVDLYRLDTPEQIIGAGLEEYFRPAGVTVIEWAEKFPGFNKLIANIRFRRVNFEVLGETERRITYEDSGH